MAGIFLLYTYSVAFSRLLFATYLFVLGHDSKTLEGMSVFSRTHSLFLKLSCCLALSFGMIGCASTDSMMGRATLSAAGNDCSKAERDWKRVLKKDPTEGKAYVGLARCAYERKDFKQAVQHMDAAIDRGRAVPDTWHTERADLYFRWSSLPSHEPSEIERLSTLALQLGTQFGDAARSRRASARFQMGREAAQAGEHRRAGELFQAALTDEPTFDNAKWALADSLHNQGLASWDAGDLTSAVRHWSRAIELVPGHADATAARVEAYLKQAKDHFARRHLEETFKLLKRALEDDPHHEPSLQEMAQVLVARGREQQQERNHVQALDFFQQAMGYNSQSVDAAEGQGLSVFKLWTSLDPSASTAELETLWDHAEQAKQALQISEDHRLRAQMHLVLAGLGLELGKNSIALEQARLGLELPPPADAKDLKYDLLKTRGQAALEVAAGFVGSPEHHEQALELLGLTEGIPALRPWAQLKKGELYAAQLNYEKAIAESSQVLGSGQDPEIQLTGKLQLARFSAIMGLHDQAVEHLYDLYTIPETYEEATERVKADVNDFYNVYLDRRFQNWLDGKKRLQFFTQKATLLRCFDKGTSGLCDPYFKLTDQDDQVIQVADSFVENSKVASWPGAFVIHDFNLEEAYWIQIWDEDQFLNGSDDLVGKAAVEREHLLTRGLQRQEIKDAGGVVGYVEFEVRETAADPISSGAIRVAPSVGVLSWPITSCLTRFGLSVSPIWIPIRTALMQISAAAQGASVDLQSLLKEFVTVYLPQILASSRTRVGLSLIELSDCILRHAIPDYPTDPETIRIDVAD